MVKSWISQTWDMLRDDPIKLAQFERDLLKLQRNLEERPKRFGEPVDDLTTLKITRCIGFTRILIANYGIIPQHKMVVVNMLRLRK